MLFFHAGFSTFGGGYIGVDVFFVISGYLITNIIAAEIDRNHFSIAKFYDRRVRRIIPALLVVIVFCIAMGFWLMTPRDFEHLGQSVFASIFFISNIYFWKRINYFEQNATEQPLLHTWSLSIEEQFYLVYPLLLVLLSKFKRVYGLTVLCLLSLISFSASVILVYYKPSAVFYLGPTRAWELLFGGLSALVGPRYFLNANMRTAVAFLGLLFILIPIFVYTHSTRFPGLAALPPVLGSVLLIWTGMRTQTPIHKMLSATPFVAVGRLSYSLYLWHLPLIVFYIYVTGDKLSLFGGTMICLTALIISFFSLRVVETPFRFPKGRNVQYFVSAMIGALVVGSTGALVVAMGGLPSRLDRASTIYLETEADKEKYHTECLSLEDHIVSPSNACQLGTANVEPSVLLWGDSHAMVTATAMEQAALRARKSFLFAASVDCPIGLGFSIDPTIGPSFVATPGYQYCGEYNQEMLEFAANKPSIKKIVLSSRWTNWRIGEPGTASEGPVDIRLRTSKGTARAPIENKEIFAVGFERLINLLSKSGKEIWIVGPLPEPAVRVPKALYIHHLGFDGSRDINISRLAFEEKNKWINTFFDQLSSRYRLKFLLPASVLCSTGVCVMSEHGKPIFFDDNHLSLFGVAKTSFLYDEIFKTRPSLNPLLDK